MESARSTAYATRVADDELSELASAPEGARNQVAFKVACRLHEIINAGWADAAAFEQAFHSACAMADRGGKDPFPMSEARDIWTHSRGRVGGSSAVLPQDTLGGEDFTPAQVPTPVRVEAEVKPMPLFEDPDPIGKPSSFAAPAATSPPIEPTSAAGLPLADRLLTPDEMIALPAPEPLIRGLLNLKSGAWLLGPPGVYKTFVAISLAACVGTGSPWLGKEVKRHNVLYVLAEDPGGAGIRFEAWKKAHWPLEGVFVLPEAIQYDDLSTWADIAETARQLDAGMIVIDTQARVTVGIDENMAKEMGRYVALVEALKNETGACVLTVHHTGPEGLRARGSTVQDGAHDTALLLRRPIGTDLIVEMDMSKQKSMEASSEPIRIKLGKVRLPARENWPEGITSLAVMGPAPSFDGDTDTFAHVGAAGAQAAIVKAITECGLGQGLTKGETSSLCKAQGISTAEFLAAWNHAVDFGVLHQSDVKPSLYVVADQYSQEELGG